MSRDSHVKYWMHRTRKVRDKLPAGYELINNFPGQGYEGARQTRKDRPAGSGMADARIRPAVLKIS